MGADWRDSQVRHLVHYSNGGPARANAASRLHPGDELADDGTRYVVAWSHR